MLTLRPKIVISSVWSKFADPRSYRPLGMQIVQLIGEIRKSVWMNIQTIRQLLTQATILTQHLFDASEQLKQIHAAAISHVESSPKRCQVGRATESHSGIFNFKNNVGPQIRRLRNQLGWSQVILSTKLQIAGWDISRSGVSKIESRFGKRSGISTFKTSARKTRARSST